MDTYNSNFQYLYKNEAFKQGENMKALESLGVSLRDWSDPHLKIIPLGCHASIQAKCRFRLLE